MNNFYNRGLNLEQIINNTIKYYSKKQLAVLNKNFVPVKFRSIKKKNHRLWLESAWITHKSTVDYSGIYQGKFIAFEAKSTIQSKFWIKNIPSHQWKYLEMISHHQAIAFLLIGFEHVCRYFVIDFKTLQSFPFKYINCDLAQENGYELMFLNAKIFNLIPIIEQMIKNQTDK